MAKCNLGQTLELQPKTAYVIITDGEDTVTFSAVDTFDYETDEGIPMACMARGMIEVAKNKPEEIISVGRDALIAEGLLKEADVEQIKTAEGKIIQFPKTKGNA